MADQNLVATHHVSFLVEQLSYLIKQTRDCWTKPFGTFCLFFLDSIDLWHYPSKYSKGLIER